MPWSSMKSVPKALKTAGLTLPQANVWAKFYDQGKASGMKSAGGFAWYRFKQEYKKEGDGWSKKEIKKDDVALPYILKDEAILREGDANGIFYSAEEIQKAIPYLLEEVTNETDASVRHKNSVFCDHDDMEEGTWKWVGDFKNPRWDDKDKVMRADVYIVDANIARKIDYQLKSGPPRFGISPRLGIKELNGRASEIVFKGISLVIFPAGGPQLMLTKEKSFSMVTSTFFKANDEEHIVYGVVLEPEYVDSQGDYFESKEVRKTAHNFMENYRILTVQHCDKFGKPTPLLSEHLSESWNSFWNLKILESYLAPCDFSMNGATIKKDSWILGVRVNEPEIWEKVKSGEVTGFSIGGYADIA